MGFNELKIPGWATAASHIWSSTWSAESGWWLLDGKVILSSSELAQDPKAG
jgi:hypothetical protein